MPNASTAWVWETQIRFPNVDLQSSPREVSSTPGTSTLSPLHSFWTALVNSGTHSAVDDPEETHKQTLSPKPIESAPLLPDSAPHYLSGVLRHIFLYLLCNFSLTSRLAKPLLVKPPVPLQTSSPHGAWCNLSQNREPYSLNPRT